MHLKHPILLCGPMCSGKTSLGTLLSEKLGWRFIDLDLELAQKEGSGKTHSEIFFLFGEKHYRTLEEEALRSLQGEKEMIIALGGGTLTSPASATLAKSLGTLIELKAKADILSERINTSRPNFRKQFEGVDVDFMAWYLGSRAKQYKEYSDAAVEITGKTPAQIADEIIHIAWESTNVSQ